MVSMLLVRISKKFFKRRSRFDVGKFVFSNRIVLISETQSLSAVSYTHLTLPTKRIV